jgi:hypothetical protein
VQGVLLQSNKDRGCGLMEIKQQGAFCKSWMDLDLVGILTERVVSPGR